MRRSSGLVVCVVVVLLANASTGWAGRLPHQRKVFVGRSVQGRAIVAHRVGDLNSPRKALIVGNTHGDEPDSWVVARALRHMRRIQGVDLWIIDTINPDGLVRGQRKNAHGVDLNRNFPYRWRRALPPAARFYQGPRALSEPESRAVYRLLRLLRPAVSIWYHQPYANVAIPHDRPAVALRYAHLAHWAADRLPGPDYRGTINAWQNHVFPQTDAFVVEFADHAPSRAVLRRHIDAALTVAIGPRRAAREHAGAKQPA